MTKTKYIVFYNPKGGVCKSTLCERVTHELIRTGHTCSVDNLDHQHHVHIISDEKAQFQLYDTMGVLRDNAIKLLNNASLDHVDAKIIIPIGIGVNDWDEFEALIIDRIKDSNLVDKCIFVFTRTRKNSRHVKEKRLLLDSHGFKHAKYVFPAIDAFALKEDNTRTRNEISQFINEIIL